MTKEFKAFIFTMNAIIVICLMLFGIWCLVGFLSDTIKAAM